MSMSMRDQAKLLEAGFSIFRKDDIRLVITKAARAGGWTKHNGYKTKAAMLRDWDSLMACPRNIEG